MDFCLAPSADRCLNREEGSVELPLITWLQAPLYFNQGCVLSEMWFVADSYNNAAA